MSSLHLGQVQIGQLCACKHSPGSLCLILEVIGLKKPGAQYKEACREAMGRDREPCLAGQHLGRTWCVMLLRAQFLSQQQSSYFTGVLFLGVGAALVRDCVCYEHLYICVSVSCLQATCTHKIPKDRA